MKVLTISSLLLAGTALAADGGSWGYDGKQGPEYWGSLSAKNVVCDSGKNQSPIDINNMIEGSLSDLNLSYQANGYQVVNNGHTVQVNFKAGNDMNVNGRSFELKQFHFHTPSENTIQGQSFPMEVHLVHADDNGNLAVIGVMFKVGEENTELEKAWSKMPAEADQKNKLAKMINAEKLLPANRSYYRFDGSLTTPPCSEGVNWFVMKFPIEASKEQIEQFKKVVGHDNNRPVQPINARIVVQ